MRTSPFPPWREPQRNHIPVYNFSGSRCKQKSIVKKKGRTILWLWGGVAVGLGITT